ncbi:TPR domain-containing protein [Zymoseptoria brevis]|uniref:TPR domain-containing protein n=1 Tax=Zymoseptoria brevis TaxID=1047168 RepID=A0A0F4GQ06_9PEZI|nr:TPR domain-containing protein [Zymoseptoria brevis]
MATPQSNEELTKQRDDLLAFQKKLHRTANSRRGQPAKNKPSRADLQGQFTDLAAQQAAAIPPGQTNIRQSIVSYAYPPCTRPLAELKPITIGELRVETNHRGRVLFVKTFGVPKRFQAVQNAVEDDVGSVDRLSVYNFEPLLTPNEVLPRDVVFAVKEPYYKATADGGVSLRIDHPSDLIRLFDDDGRVPLGLQPRLRELCEDQSQKDWKDKGNEAFKVKDFRGAAESYSKGLKITGSGIKHVTGKKDLLRNRAIAHIHLGWYEAGLEDAQRTVIMTGGQNQDFEKSKVNAKAFYRAGCAAYQLRKFQLAKSEFQKALQCATYDDDAIRELVRTERRLREQETGTYTFDDMVETVKRKQRRLDHADYDLKVISRQSKTGGNGLFANESIKAGELVLCEKAYAVAFNDENETESTVIINMNRDTMSMGTHATRLVSVMHKLMHNPEQASKFSKLYDGGYQPKSITSLVDGVVPVDNFQVQAALEVNGFGCPATATALGGDEDPSGNGVSTGVWITASLINHDCIGNAQRSFIGDFMIVRATKDIAKDEEILQRYKNETDNYDEFQKTVQQSWGFKCKCRLCVAESKTSGQQRKHRVGLLIKAKEFLVDNDLDRTTAPAKAMVTQAEKLWKRIDQSYDDKHFVHGLPRLGLHDLAHWLCMAHLLQHSDKLTVREWATRCLHSQGLMIEMVDGKLTIDRKLARPDITGVHAATYMASTYEEEDVKTQFEDLAKELYQIGHGVMYGYNSTSQVQARS